MAIIPASIANQLPLLKEYYQDWVVENLTYQNRPLFYMIAKGSVEGKLFPVPQIYSNGAGISADFATGQQNQSPMQSVAFQCTTVPKYAFGQIDGQAIAASKTNSGAWANLYRELIDTKVKQLGYSLNYDLFGAGNGIIGTIKSVSGSTFTLTSASDSYRFYVGQLLQYVTTATGGTPAALGQIQKIDRQAGIITLTAAVVGAVAGNFVLNAGDYGKCLTGLAGWIPSTTPTTGDSFFGVDRSVDPTKLAGTIVQAQGAPILEVVNTLSSQIYIQGGRPDVLVMHPTKMTELRNAVQPNIRYENEVLEDIKLTFKYAMLPTDFNEMKIVVDAAMPTNLIYALQIDTWKLMSLSGILLEALDDDNLTALRVQNADAVELRWRSYSQLQCKAVGYNGVAVF